MKKLARIINFGILLHKNCKFHSIFQVPYCFALKILIYDFLHFDVCPPFSHACIWHIKAKR